MLISTIIWTVYDGTAKTRPHSLRAEYWDLPKEKRAPMEAQYMLKRHGETSIEDQAFSLHVRKRHNEKRDTYVFERWFWQSAWLNNYESNEKFDLSIGDMWAPWPARIETVELPAFKKAVKPKAGGRTGNNAPDLRRAMAEYTVDPGLLDALEQFRVMREKIKKPLTLRALQLIFAELDRLSGGDNAVKGWILEQSIVNCWRGVFALKGGVGGGRRAAGAHGNSKADGSAREYGQSDFGALGE